MIQNEIYCHVNGFLKWNISKKTRKNVCLKCRKNTESENPKVVRTKNGRIMLLSRCAVWNRKHFLKEKKLKDY